MKKMFLIIVLMMIMFYSVSCDPDSVSETETDTSSDVNDDSDSGDNSQTNYEVPEGMVLIPANPNLGINQPFFIDKYEASRPDATDSSMGIDNSIAVSREGVIPWYVNPMSSEALAEMQAACAAAGKRLCTAAEWTAACSGSSNTTYAFGNSFDPLTCNCIDSFCSEHCSDAGIAPGECDTSENCGSVYGCYKVVPTGTFPDCLSVEEVFDLNGNVWEAVISDVDTRGYEMRGGGFNSASAESRLTCGFNAGWNSLYAGFRCCMDAE